MEEVVGADLPRRLKGQMDVEEVIEEVEKENLPVSQKAAHEAAAIQAGQIRPGQNRPLSPAEVVRRRLGGQNR